MKITLETKVAKKVLSALKVGADMKSSLPALKHALVLATRSGYKFVSTDLRGVCEIDYPISHSHPHQKSALFGIPSMSKTLTESKTKTITFEGCSVVGKEEFPPFEVNKGRYLNSLNIVPMIKLASEIGGDRVSISVCGEELQLRSYTQQALYDLSIYCGYSGITSSAQILPAEQLKKAVTIFTTLTKGITDVFLRSGGMEGIRLVGSSGDGITVSYYIPNFIASFPNFEKVTNFTSLSEQPHYSVASVGLCKAMRYVQSRNVLMSFGKSELLLSSPQQHGCKAKTEAKECGKAGGYEFILDTKKILPVLAGIDGTVRLYPPHSHNSKMPLRIEWRRNNRRNKCLIMPVILP